MQSKGEILIYKAKDGSQQLEVKLEEETVWLNQKQMAILFEKNLMTVNGHINNIFKEKELDKKSGIRKSLITAADGKKYETLIYNLDVIISVGYRVNSKRGTPPTRTFESDDNFFAIEKASFTSPPTLLPPSGL